MNEQVIPIVPQDITEVRTVVSFAINRVSVNLFENANIEVYLYDSNKNIIKVDFIELTNAEYAEWGNDDKYITNLVCTKLGFVLPS